MAKRRTTVNIELNEKSKSISWENAIELFISSMKIKGLSYNTRRWYKENLIAIVKVLKVLGLELDPVLITESMVKEIVLKMVNSGLSSTTVNHRVRSIKQFYKFLVKEGYISINPAEKLERKKSKTVKIQAFTEEQLIALLAVTDKSRFVGFRDYTMILFMLDTGVRVSELVGIKLVDIRLKDGEVLITEGKGGKQRRVFVSSKTKEMLRKYLRTRGEITGNEHLFITSDNKPMKQRTVQERLTIYGKMAKLTGVRVSPHTFRHTFAKMYIMRGGDPFSLQALLGHSTLEMVRHYVNLWGSDLQKMHRQFSPVDQLFR